MIWNTHFNRVGTRTPSVSLWAEESSPEESAHKYALHARSVVRSIESFKLLHCARYTEETTSRSSPA